MQFLLEVGDAEFIGSEGCVYLVFDGGGGVLGFVVELQVPCGGDDV